MEGGRRSSCYGPDNNSDAMEDAHYNPLGHGGSDADVVASGPAATIGVLVLQRRRRSGGCERCRNRFGVEGWCFTRAVAIDLDNLETPAAMAN
jgi:hypothetical protein